MLGELGSSPRSNLDIKNIPVANSLPRLSRYANHLVKCQEKGCRMEMTKESKKSRAPAKKVVRNTSPLPDFQDLMPISDLAKQLPKRVSYNTLHGWMEDGRASISGKNVKLKWWKMPYGRASTIQAYREFLMELNT